MSCVGSSRRTRRNGKARIRFAALATLLVALPSTVAEDRTSAARNKSSLPESSVPVAAAPASDSDRETDPLPDLETPVTVNGRGRVELHVAEMPLSDVLQMLSLKGQRNIIASPNVKGTVTADLYGATFEQALDAILLANGAGYRTVGDFIYVHTKAELREIDATSARKPYTRVFKLNYLSAADAKTYITQILGEEDDLGSVVASPPPGGGIGSNASDSGGYATASQDFVVVTARPEEMDQVEHLIRQLDVRPEQILVEATIMRAELTDDNALGIDFTIVGGVDLELMGARSPALSSLTLGTLPDDRFEQMNAIAATDVSGDIPGGGLTLGIIKDQVAVFVRALEQVTDTTVVAHPKVLALNKQKGQVIVGRRDGYLTTTVTETQATQQVEFLETGTRLIFRPFVCDDGFIRVELHPEDSVGFVNAQGLPSEQTTEVTTNVIVRDGDTILIGGLFREVTTDARKQVPGLGSIPGIGPLFRTNIESTAREEVIILLTITIVRDHASYANSSWEKLQDAERIRVGLRQGLMWQGRERMAQVQYRKALDCYNGGDPDKALWHVKLALYNSARMVSALKLREQILGERLWEDDTASAREFIYDMIARQRPAARLPFARPRIADRPTPISSAVDSSEADPRDTTEDSTP